ncbi:MAG: hypothetical protein P1P88_13525 [Bacteroidales bacterium]|nr:hypothetical protein [Bacteroidales bacterium]
MKFKLSLIVLFCLNLLSCEKNKVEPIYPIGEGFELYLTVAPYSSMPVFDYNTIDFDTIALFDSPLLRYNDLNKYDTISHKLTLNISHDSLNFGFSGVYGRMFVATIDKEPIYCGFFWPLNSSVPSNWVFIEEPYEELDHLNDNELVISFVSEIYSDPRLDKRITDRLKIDGKIK